MTIKEQAVSDAVIEKVWADFVNCHDDRYFGNKTKRAHQLIVLRRFADDILASHPLEQQQAGVGRMRELLERWLRLADSGHFRDGAELSLAAHPVADDTRTALQEGD